MTEAAAGGAGSQNPNAAAGGNPAGAGAGEGAAGTGGNEFLTWFPEDLRSEKTLEKFKGKDKDEVLGKLAKSYVHLEKWQIPNADAKPEERAAFHRRLGIPEKVEEYAGTLKPEVPTGVPWNTEIQSQFAAMAHAEGLTAAQANKVLNFYLSRAGQGVDIQKTTDADALKKAHDGLKTRWGANYQRNTGLVHRAVEEYGNEEFSTMLDSVVVKDASGQEIKLGSHPAMLEFLANYGEQRLEAGFIPGDSLLMTSDSAQAELSKILDDPKHPYWQGDKAALAKVQSLLAVADAPKVRR